MGTYARAGNVEWRETRLLALLAALGATLVARLPLDWLTAATRPRMGATAFNLTIFPLVGCYDGMFGPGAGSFYMLGFVALLGYGVVRATAQTKIANFASNLAALAALSLILLNHKIEGDSRREQIW